MNIDIAYSIAINDSTNADGVIDFEKALLLFYELLNTPITWQ